MPQETQDAVHGSKNSSHQRCTGSEKHEGIKLIRDTRGHKACYVHHKNRADQSKIIDALDLPATQKIRSARCVDCRSPEIFRRILQTCPLFHQPFCKFSSQVTSGHFAFKDDYTIGRSLTCSVFRHCRIKRYWEHCNTEGTRKSEPLGEMKPVQTERRMEAVQYKQESDQDIIRHYIRNHNHFWHMQDY